MAIASNKKSADQRNGAARGKAAGKPSGRKAPAAATGKRSAPRSDDGEGPERSSPALAEVDADVLEFIAAIDRFKLENGRPFPSWSEVLLVVRQLGYRRP
jgi:hypothetical protein